MTHDAMFDRRLLAHYEHQRKTHQRPLFVSASGQPERDEELERVVHMLESEIRTYWQILDRATKEEDTNVTSDADPS